MGFFKRSRKKEILDLTERYKKQQERLQETESEAESQSSGGAFSFLGNLAGSGSSGSAAEITETETTYVDVSGVDERRRKLAKRLMDMTTKLEDISNQIYHLQQRIEVLEKKMGVGNF